MEAIQAGMKRHDWVIYFMSRIVTGRTGSSKALQLAFLLQRSVESVIKFPKLS